jgi:hypothetical protein
MGMANGVEAKGCTLDIRVDPSFVPVRTCQQDLLEGGVPGDRKTPRTDPLGKRMRQVELIERNDRPASRFDPENIARMAAVGHWEDAGGIASQQHPRIETLAHLPTALTAT